MQHHEYADLYVRLSLDSEGKTAIERQEKDCREWCDRNGLKVREVHVDRGRSGFKKGVKRTGFDAAVAAVSSGVVGTLVVWKLDRLSRQGMVQVDSVIERLNDVGGRLVSVQDGLDSSQPNTRMVIAMLSELARSESENIGLRVRSAKVHLRASGRWIGGRAPYGLVARDGRLHVDPETGPVVREMARRILDGTSLTKVTRWLNAEKIPSPLGGKWQTGSVAQLLRGPATAGLLPETVKKADGSGYSGVVRPWRDPETGQTVSVMAEGQEPLICPSDQARIVALFAERARMTSWGIATGALQGESRHLLTGLLRCAGCGGRMSKQGNSYRCQTVRLGRSCEAPAGGYQETLDAAVTKAWIRRLTTAEPGDPLLDAIAERWVEQHDPEVENRRSVLDALDQERAALASLDDDFYVHRSIHRERYERVSLDLVRRIEGLTRTLDANPLPEAEISALLDPQLVREAWDAADVKDRRDLLRLALVKVRCSQGIRGQRFDPVARLTFVWATIPPTVTGAQPHAKQQRQLGDRPQGQGDADTVAEDLHGISRGDAGGPTNEEGTA